MYTFDLITHNGDITQDGKEEQVQDFKKVFESYFDPTETPLMFCYGNHDTCWSGCMNVGEFYEAFGAKYFTKDLEQDRSKTGSRHMIVNGYHFFSIEMRSYGPNNNNISLSDENWIRNQLKEITKANPNQYVFISTHSPAKIRRLALMMMTHQAFGDLHKPYAICLKISLKWYTFQVIPTMPQTLIVLLLRQATLFLLLLHPLLILPSITYRLRNGRTLI